MKKQEELTEIEKHIRQRVEEGAERTIEGLPELRINDVKVMLDRFDARGWEYETEVDWDGRIIVDFYQEKRSKKSDKYYVMWFDPEGYLESVYSEWEFEAKHGEETVETMRERVEKAQELLDQASAVMSEY